MQITARAREQPVREDNSLSIPAASPQTVPVPIDQSYLNADSCRHNVAKPRGIGLALVCHCPQAGKAWSAGVQEAYCLSSINFNLLCQTAARTWAQYESPLDSSLLLSVSCQLAFQADRLTPQEYFHQLANQC